MNQLIFSQFESNPFCFIVRLPVAPIKFWWILSVWAAIFTARHCQVYVCAQSESKYQQTHTHTVTHPPNTLAASLSLARSLADCALCVCAAMLLRLQLTVSVRNVLLFCLRLRTAHIDNLRHICVVVSPLSLSLYAFEITKKMDDWLFYQIINTRH